MIRASKNLSAFSTIKSVGRFKTILSVFARHGFENIAERATMGRYVLDKFTKIDVNKHSTPERLRMAFEELGPTFVKLGQLLAGRPDLVPIEFCDEFKKLQDQVTTVDFKLMRKVVEDHYGDDLEEIFASFNSDPIGAASIAQVYKATLRTGEPVVVKVQRPGIRKIIFEDLNVLYALAELITAYVPDANIYNPVGVVDEFFKSLKLETNFIVEANNIKRFQKNFKDFEGIKIPSVFLSHSGEQVLVMEQLEGLPLSNKRALEQKDVNKDKLISTAVKCYFKMVFTDGLFHGDMHPGNLFVTPEGQLGLIDFGQVGRLNPKTRNSISNMFIALATENYERFAYEYIELSPYNGPVDVDILSRQIRDLVAPFYGLTLDNINTGRLLMQTTSIAARNNLMLPAELVMFFKSVVNVEALGKMVKKDFDALEFALDFAKEVAGAKYDKTKLLKDLSYLAKDTNNLLVGMPRQLKQVLRKWNSPDHSMSISIKEIKDLRRSLNHSSSLLFLGLVIGSLILSSSLVVALSKVPGDMPILSIVGYAIASVLSLVAVIDYIKR